MRLYDYPPWNTNCGRQQNRKTTCNAICLHADCNATIEVVE